MVVDKCHTVKGVRVGEKVNGSYAHLYVAGREGFPHLPHFCRGDPPDDKDDEQRMVTRARLTDVHEEPANHSTFTSINIIF